MINAFRIQWWSGEATGLDGLDIPSPAGFSFHLTAQDAADYFMAKVAHLPQYGTDDLPARKRGVREMIAEAVQIPESSLLGQRLTADRSLRVKGVGDNSPELLREARALQPLGKEIGIAWAGRPASSSTLARGAVP